MQPAYWGNHIYEAAMGLYLTEEEAKKESWREENYFPLYSQEQVKEFQDEIISLNNRIMSLKVNFNVADSNLKGLSDKICDLQGKLHFMSERVKLAEKSMAAAYAWPNDGDPRTEHVKASFREYRETYPVAHMAEKGLPESDKPHFANWCIEDIREAVHEGEIEYDDVVNYFNQIKGAPNEKTT